MSSILEALGHPAELGQAVAAGRFLGVDAEDAVPVAVKGERKPVRENMRLQRAKIGLRRLARRKLQRRQPAGRVVDEHDQRAARAAPLQPIVRAAVDLNQFAKAPAPLARLMNPPRPPPLRPRKPESDLQTANELARHRDPLQLAELLGRQRRAEITIFVPQQPGDPRAQPRRHPPRRNPPPLARNQPPIAPSPPNPHKPLDLPHPERKPLRRNNLRKHTLANLPNHKRPLPLDSAHPQYPLHHENAPPTQPPKGTFSRC